MKQLIYNSRLIIKRFRVTTLFSVIGLSVACAAFVLIMQYASFELGFDKFQEKRRSVFMLMLGITDRVGPAQTGKDLMKTIPEIKNSTALCTWGSNFSTDKSPDSPIGINFTSCEPSIIDMFTFKVLAGDSKKALNSLYGVMMSKREAMRVFGEEFPIGKKLYEKERGGVFTVYAIYDDLPRNSSLRSTMIINLETLDSWIKNKISHDPSEWSFVTYLEAEPKDLPAIQAKIRKTDVFKDIRGNYPKVSDADIFSFVPLGDIHFSKNENGNRKKVNIFILLGYIILIIGLINHINFSLAMVPVRIRMINTQKVFGAGIKELRWSIALESVLIAFVSLCFGVSLVYILQSTSLSQLFSFELNPFTDKITLFLIVMSVLLAASLAGLYPARYMTKINPAVVLKGTFIMTPGGRKLRNSLLAFQYTTTVALIIVVVFILQQSRYLQNFNPGYEKENIICIRNTTGIVKHYKSIENKLRQHAGVLDVCWAGNLPGEVGMGWGREINGTHINITVWPVSKGFPRFFGIKAIKGRDFSFTDSADINNFIVNEAAVSAYGRDIFDIGKLIHAFDTTGTIIGICKDFNFNSLYNSVTPMALWIPTDQRNQVTFVKLKPGNQPVVIEEIRKSILQISEEKTLEWLFLNDQLNDLYSSERNLGRLLTIFAVIAVIISALGIIGLVILNARFQVKQTGLRKLLGASFIDLILASNKTISFIMLISSIISIPIAWYFVHKWLQQYPYQVSMNPLVFVLVPLVVMLILSLLISILSIRAARRNPVESLRYE